MKNISINLKSFFEFSGKMLELECVYGEQLLNRSIQEAVLNRPGLALSGFQKYFAKDRIQVLGMAEYAYLRNLNGEDRRNALTDFFKHRFPCLILARNRKALELAGEFAVLNFSHAGPSRPGWAAPPA